MKHSPADALRAYYVLAGLCTDPAVSPSSPWNAYVDALADGRDQVLMFSNTPGLLEGRNNRTGQTVEKQGVQIYTRSGDQFDAWKKANAIALTADAILRQKFTFESQTYMLQAVNRRGSILPLNDKREEKEQANRSFAYVTNYSVSFSEVSARSYLPASTLIPTVTGPWFAQVPVGAVNGINNVYTITVPPVTSVATLLFVNGVLKSRATGGDYTLLVDTITFTSGNYPQLGDVLSFVWIDQG